MDWVPLNLADTRDALQKWISMEQRGQWICGYHHGASGSILMGSESEAFVHGHTLGTIAYTDSMEHRSSVSTSRKKAADIRWERERERKNAIADANACTNADAIEYANDMHSTVQDKTIQDITGKEQRTRARSEERFVPPTESEWVAYCSLTWPDWHPECSANSWAYYQGVGWKSGKTKLKDWKSAARTSHGKAIENGYLQPKNSVQRVAKQRMDTPLSDYEKSELEYLKTLPTLEQMLGIE